MNTCSAAVELCLSVAMLSPTVSLVTLVRMVVDYVLETGHETFCVAPRGIILAQFVVQALVMAVHVQMGRNSHQNASAVDDEPSKAKKSRVETA